ncbi:MAG: glycosyltransferase, partial [Acidobacteriota bacterium]|nr:glycosyltransferase [Acidobacteriota bacterium]
MTIAYVITRADAVGGASIHVRDLARAMLERGHRVVVLVGGVGAVSDQLADAGIPFQSLQFLRRPVQPLGDWRAVAELISVLRQMRPDLVSAHTAKAGFIARAACARLGIPSIYTPHGWVIDDRISIAWGAVFSTAERLASRWTRATICVCEYERQLAIRKRLGAEQKLFVVHNGVRDVGAGLRADTGRSAIRICSVARLDSPKDHSTLLRALAELRSETWELDLVGDGPLESARRKQAAVLGIGKRVHFMGYQPNPAGTLARAQIFVLASRSEAFPRSILEAMRAG